jgi:flagellar biosynthesis protein FlhG
MSRPDPAQRQASILPVVGGPVRVIAVTGGKGGVGKTTVAVNLATALAQSGQRVLLLDGDLGLANVDVLLGLAPRYSLADVLAGDRTIEEVIVEAPSGLRVVPAASGIARMASLTPTEHLGLVQAFSGLAARLDTLIVDTSAGLADAVLRFSAASQHVLVVVRDEPASITDAYAVIKVLSREHGVRRFRVLVNMARTAAHGQSVHERLQRVTERYLDITLDYVGEVPDDEWLSRSIREQRPVVEAYPSSRASLALKKLARLADTWPVPAGPRGHLEFFVERLVRRAIGPVGVVQ